MNQKDDNDEIGPLLLAIFMEHPNHEHFDHILNPISLSNPHTASDDETEGSPMPNSDGMQKIDPTKCCRYIDCILGQSFTVKEMYSSLVMLIFRSLIVFFPDRSYSLSIASRSHFLLWIKGRNTALTIVKTMNQSIAKATTTQNRSLMVGESSKIIVTRCCLMSEEESMFDDDC